MRKRIVSFMLAGVLLMSMVSGCATSGKKQTENGSGQKPTGGSEEKVTLSFLNKYPEEPYVKYFETAVAEFEAQNPNIDIQMENVSDEAIKDKLTVIASGGDMPDIYMSWTGERVKRFARGEKALDLTPYLEADQEWADSFLPAFLNNSTVDGKTYAIPYRSGFMYMLYNKEIFEANGYKLPATWDELTALCEQIKTTDVTPIAFGNASPWYASWWIGALNAQMISKEVMNKDYNPTTGEFTDENYVKAVQTFLDLNHGGYFGDHVNSKDYYQVREEFFVGKSAMILDATPQFTQYDEGMGAEKWGYFVIPTIEGAAGDSKMASGGGEAWLISGNCAHPEEAVAFLKFMTSKKMAAKQTKEAGLPNALIGGITADHSTAALAAAYTDAVTFTDVHDWLDCAVEASIADQYMIGLQEGLDGKSAEDIMAEVQEAAAKVKAENK